MSTIVYLVHSIPKYEKSGTPIAAWRVAKGVKEKYNQNVAFIIPSPDGEEGKEKVDDILVYKVKRIDWHENFFHDFDIDRETYIRKIKNILKEVNCNILHIYNLVFSSYQVMKLRKEGIRIVCIITHTEDICFNVDPFVKVGDKIEICSGPDPIAKCACHYKQMYGGNNLMEFIIKKISKHFTSVELLYSNFCDIITFTNEEFAKYFTNYVNIPRDVIRIIPHGVENKLEKYILPNMPKNEGFRFLYLGGDNFRKGFVILDNALNSLNGELFNKIKEITIVGKTTKEFRERFNNDKYMFKGVLPEEELYNEISNADLVILPTFFETYNISLREAIKLGKPVITTKTFGSNIVVDGYNGFRFDIGDSLQLKNIIELILSNPQILVDMSKNCLNTHITDIEEEIKLFMKVYNELKD